MGRRLFLIDGNSLINRAFYALPPLNTPGGEPSNAVYGLTRMLFRLKDDYDPEQIIVAFDVSGPTFRHEQFDAYKAHRKPMPDDLRSQIPLMKDVLDALGIARLELPGFEADDLLGTMAKQGETAGFEVFIVTGDRDAFQLVSERTSVLFTRRGITDTELVDQEFLQKEYGVSPAQVPDLKGLMGDSSDNIPGVPGVGEKTALRLLGDYGSMERLYEHLDQLSGKLKERLEQFKDQAFLSRELATIKRDAPVSSDFKKPEPAEGAILQELFLSLGFKTLLDRLPAAEDAPEISYLSVDSLNLPGVLQSLKGASRLFVGVFPEQKRLACLAADQALLIPFDLVEEQREEFGQIFRSKELYALEGKALQHLLGSAREPFLIRFDLLLALYCLNPETRWDAPALASHFGESLPPVPATDPSFPLHYLHLLEKLAGRIEKELETAGLSPLYHQVELPLASLLFEMEACGISVDPLRLQEISQDLDSVLGRLTASIHSQAGEEFNINSPKQLGVVLFEKMGLPVLKRTKTGPSTSAEVLEELSQYPIVNDVLEYRQVAKLKSTYTDALAALISPQTGRIHTTFNQTVTATGRLSSTHPNLQNIPVRTAEGRRIREAFVAPSGFQLLSADYSQIELRLLAHLSQDEVLIDAFCKGRDIHLQTASEVFEVPLEQVTSEQRSAAKAINFGIVYGISSFGLAKGINLTRVQAQAYIDSYFRRYPRVKSYLDQLVDTARSQGYVTTLLQRRRYLPNIKSRNFAIRNFAARTAMNSPIQGSAADVIKLAMLNVSRALKSQQLATKLLLQVHDELVFEVPLNELKQAASLVKKEMESVLELDVPLVVDLFSGPNWSEVQPLVLKEQA